MIRQTPLFLLTALVSATSLAEQASTTVELNGIAHVYLLGKHELILTQGDKEQVTVTTEREYLEELQGRIKGDVLALGSQHESGWSWFSRSDDEPKARFEVQLREPRSVTLRGSGDVSVNDIRIDADFLLGNHGSGNVTTRSIAARQLELRSAGSGDTRLGAVEAEELSLRSDGSGDTAIDNIRVQRTQMSLAGSGEVEVEGGETTQLEVSLNGSGEVRAAALRSQAVEVSINGSGDVSVWAETSLKVRINGSGDVQYRGEPEVDQVVRGSGDVEAQR